MIKLIITINFALILNFAHGVEEVKVMPRLKLVGVILDQSEPLKNTVLVIKDVVRSQTYTILGSKTIPHTSFKLSGIGRNYILVSDGYKTMQINQVVQDTSMAAIAVEPNSLDELDSDAIIARSNLAWKRLEEKAKEKNIQLFERMKPKGLIGSENVIERCEGDCSEEMSEDEYSDEEQTENQPDEIEEQSLSLIHI